jgi:hypothetical protein
VRFPPLGLQLHSVRDLLDQGLTERVRELRRDRACGDEPLLLEVREILRDLAIGREALDHALPERPAAHRRELEHAPWTIGQAVDPRL